MRKVFYSAATIILLAFIGVTIFKPGYIYFRDVTGKLSNDTLYERYLYTYSDDVGESLSEQSRIPLFFSMFGPFIGLKKLGVVSDSFFVKLKIAFLFVGSFITFVLLTQKLLKFIYGDESRKSVVLPTILGGLFYVTNYWFTNRITHFGLFYTTITVPITFYILFTFLFSQKTSFKKLALLLVLLSLLTTTPHTILFEVLIAVSLWIAFLFTKKVILKTKIIKTFQLLWFWTLYLVVNAYWILPFLSSQSHPDTVLTETIVNRIGENTSLINSVRLMGYWLENLNDYFFEPTKLVQLILSFLPPLILIITAALVWKKKGLSLSIMILFLLGLFLASSETITNNFYFFLMFKSPLKSIGWVFREYDKFGLVLSYVYSLSITFFILRTTKKKYLITPSLLLVIGILVSNSLFLNKTLRKNYTPVQIPEDFSEVNDVLGKDISLSNSIWYPGVQKPTWSNEEDVRFSFGNLVSEVPSITTQSNIINYLNFIFNNENVYDINFGKSLDLLGVKYLIVRKDYDLPERNEYEEKLSLHKSLEKIYATELLTVYENIEFTGLVRFYDSQLISNAGLQILKGLDGSSAPRGSFIDFTDNPSGILLDRVSYQIRDGAYVDSAINDFQSKFIYPYDFVTKKYDGEPGDWKIGSLENITHAETEYYFYDEGLEISQFDYSKGVIISKEGYQKIDDDKQEIKVFSLNFSDSENAKYSGTDLLINYPETPENQMEWNSIRSALFDLNDTKSIEVSLDINTPKNLQTHFKIYFFNSEEKTIEVSFLYPDEKNNVHNIIRVPEGTKYANFGIWTRNINASCSFKLSNVKITDISDNVRPVTLSFKTDSKCSGSCTLFARVLGSRIGGNLEIDVNGTISSIQTQKDPESGHSERYEWVRGNTSSISGPAEIITKNQEGFNSINAIVFLNEDEVSKLDSRTETLSHIEEVTLSEKQKPLIKTEKINPTKYTVTISGISDEGGILAFAKPFNKNWILSSEDLDTVRVNGYINGWKLDPLGDGTYTIEYKPQKYFYIGSIISGVSLLGLAIYLLFPTKDVIVSEAKSNSQG